MHNVNKFQKGHKSLLPIHHVATSVVGEGDNSYVLLSQTSESFTKGLRGYIDTVLCAIQCSMDVQSTNGRAMLLKYVSSYVSKAKESFHSDALYCSSLSPSTTAIKFAVSLDIWKPEMLALLSSKKLSWTNATRKACALPTTIEKAQEWPILAKYYARPLQQEHITLLEWLRSVDETDAIPIPYPPHKVIAVGVKHVSYFNHFYFFQHLLCHFLIFLEILLSNSLLLLLMGAQSRCPIFLHASTVVLSSRSLE